MGCEIALRLLFSPHLDNDDAVSYMKEGPLVAKIGSPMANIGFPMPDVIDARMH